MSRLADYAYIAAMIVLTTYSQVVMRWQVGNMGALPASVSGKVGFVVAMLLNPWVLSGLVATFLAGVAWMMALTKFELSYAYPFVSLVYLAVLASGVLLFNDSMNVGKLAGTAVVLLGIFILARAS